MGIVGEEDVGRRASDLVAEKVALAKYPRGARDAELQPAQPEEPPRASASPASAFMKVMGRGTVCSSFLGSCDKVACSSEP